MVSNDFKNAIQGIRYLHGKITVGGDVYDDKDNVFIKPRFNAELFKTIMPVVDFETEVEIEPRQWVNIQIGVMIDEDTREFEYVDFGEYYINEEPTYNMDTLSWTYKGFNKMIEAMIPYQELDIEYPITYENYLIKICDHLGWDYDLSYNFPNKNSPINKDHYKDLGLTFRDVLDDVCPVSMGNFTNDGTFKILYPNDTGDVIDENWLNEDNTELFETVKPINSLVLSRAEGGDKLYRQDIEEGEEISEIEIKDSIILSSEDRELYIDEMFNYIKGFSYTPFEIETVGTLWFKPLDKFIIQKEGINYETILLNYEIDYSDGLKEMMFSPVLEQSVSNYKTSALTDKGKKMANIIAYKNEAKIEMLTSEINDLTNYIKITNRTGDYLALTDTPKSSGAINTLRIRGFELMPLYPGMAYPSEYTYPGVLSFYTLIFDTVNTFDNNPNYVFVNSPIPLQKLGDIYDELIIETNKVKVIQRIGYDFDNEQWSVLSSPITHELNDVLLPTFDGDTYISVRYFDNLIYDAEYLIKNDLTSNFATQLESSSQFKLNQNEIEAKVNKDGIISSINLSPEEIKILAERIKIEGLTTINDNFKVLLDGSIEAVNAKLSGDIFLPDGGRVIGGDGILSSLQFTSFGQYDGFSCLGFAPDTFHAGYNFYKRDVAVVYSIPTNFTPVLAYVNIQHTPITWADMDNSEKIGYSRNVRLYKDSSNRCNKYFMAFGSEYEILTDNLSGSEIDTLGGGFTGGSSIGYVSNTVGSNIASHLTEKNGTLFLRTTDANPTGTTQQKNTYSIQRTGLVKATLYIIGYTKN